MAQQVRDSFLDLEKHRQLLETNVEQLRRSLEHWQLWEAEYEGLKEEILAVQPEPSFQQLITIGREYGGSLLKQDEVDDVLGVKTGKLRSASQVTDLLSKRIDYVQQNVKTLEKQLQTAENKLAAATIISTPDAMNEEGLPLTEIFEELDDDGNVISSRLSTPGSAKAQLLEVLEKAGVKDIKEGGPDAPKEESSNGVSSEPKEPVTEEPEETAREEPKEPVNEEPKEREVIEKIETNTTPKAVKKGVTFSREIRINTFRRNSRPNLREDDSPTIKKTISFAEDEKVAKENVHPEKPVPQSTNAEEIRKVMELAEEQNKPLPPGAMIPQDESEEDAALRQEMLKYQMSELGEVGAIVAELSLEENDSGFTDDDDFDDYDDEDEEDDVDDSGMEDDEDAYGRSTRQIVDPTLHRKMRELEERLKARMMENVGPKGDVDTVHEGIAQIRIKTDEEPSAENTIEKKKGVRFADKLDIQPAPEESQDSKTSTKPEAPAKSPIGDIVERAPAPTNGSKAPAPDPAKKVSKFKSARAAQPTTTPVINQAVKAPSTTPTPPSVSKQFSESLPFKPIKVPSPFSAPIPVTFAQPPQPRPAPTGPKDSILSDNIIEHEPSSTPNVSEPDLFDADVLNQEVEKEYLRMRNRMRGGGVVGEDDDEDEMEIDGDGFGMVPVEEVGGKRVSRFMAARAKMG